MHQDVDRPSRKRSWDGRVTAHEVISGSAISGEMLEMKKEGKINLLPRDSPTRGFPYGSFGVLNPRGWYIYIGRKTLHIYIK